jgi:flagellar hook-basal body complex protein FliE
MVDIKAINVQIQGQMEGLSQTKKGEGNFANEMKDAIQKVDTLQKDADKAVQAFSVGKTTLPETMIAIEKANLSFQLMLQVRNKIVSAYEEVMKVSV